MTIPRQVHFCWIGTSLPWAYVFAVLSAAERSAITTIVLHHTDTLTEGPELDALRDCSRARLSRIEPRALLTQVGEGLGVGPRLAALYGRLDRPVMRSDILRAALLYRDGGIYLDLDTVTVASLLPLLHAAQFIGCEFIVWPRSVRESRSPAVWAVHLGLDLLRKIFRTVPGGWKMFRRIERLYCRGLNNAVMGTEAGTRLFADYLRAMLAVPTPDLVRPYALGPDLLGKTVAAYQGSDVTIQEPRVFSPLSPEISEHWFRVGRGVSLDAVLSAETRVVHWYASVRTKSRVAQIDPAYVQKHRTRQLYSMLVDSILSKPCPVSASR